MRLGDALLRGYLARLHARRIAEHFGFYDTKEKTMSNETAPDHIEQFFAYEHLPPHLAEVSRPFGELAALIVKALPRNPERTVALRKLLEAKDAAVRARLAK